MSQRSTTTTDSSQTVLLDALVQQLRTYLRGTDPLAFPPDLLGFAAIHRLDGTVYHIAPVLSEREEQQCRRAWNINVAEHLARIRTLEQVWPANAPPPLVYKGADIAENLLDDPGARACVDLDLLLPDPHFEAVADHLRQLADQTETPAYERYEHEPWVGLGFRFNGVLIELHRHPQPAHRAHLTGDAIWTRGLPSTLGRLDILQPTPEDRLLLWLANQAKNSFFGDLADLFDLALILQMTPPPTAYDLKLAGLTNAWDLAQLRLGLSGLADPILNPRRAVRWANQLLPPVWKGRIEPPQSRFQALKIWLCDPPARRATLTRALATWRRGIRPASHVQ